jgi:C-terminal processing protease CtpA/Prc
VLDRVLRRIEEEFFDEDFLTGRLPELKARVSARYECEADAAKRERILEELLGALGVSHCLLITPDMRAEIESKTADPRRLRLTWQRNGKTLLASVRSFKVRTTRLADLEEFAKELVDVGHLVLDLRLNDGGSGSVVSELAGIFLGPSTPVMQVRDREGRGMREPYVLTTLPERENLDHEAEVATIRTRHFVEYRTRPDPPTRFDGRITLLTGPTCYSCGEVFVQAMKEHSDARIVGARTAGCVVAADRFELSDGYALLLPFAEILSGTGCNIEGEGVAPHEEMDLADLGNEAILERLG